MRSVWCDVLGVALLMLLAQLTSAFYVQPRVIFFSREPDFNTLTCEGCRVELSCEIPVQLSVSKIPLPTISWQVNGSAVEVLPGVKVQSDSNSTLQWSTLVIASAAADHTGSYRCCATDGHIEDDSNCKIHPCITTRTISRESRLQVAANASSITPVTLAGCSSTVLPCNGGPPGHSPLRLWWTEDGVALDILTSEDATQQLYNGDLLIRNGSKLFTSSHRNIFECKATFDSGTIIVLSRYELQYQPEGINSAVQGRSSDSSFVHLYSTSSQLAVGSTAQLVCTSSNFCMDEVTWTKSGTSLSGDSEGDVVSLHSVQAEDSGEYCCEGVGGGGVRSDCVNLRVEDIPLSSSLQNNLTVLLNPHGPGPRNFSLNCSIGNAPLSSADTYTSTLFEWYHNGQRVVSTLHGANHSTITMVTSAGAQLVVMGSNISELYGVYQCFASNVAGVASITTRVLPYGVPNRPGSLTFTEIPHYSSARKSRIRLKWQPPEYTAGLSDLTYQLHYSTGPALQHTNETSLEIYSYTYYYLIMYLYLVDPSLSEEISEKNNFFHLIKGDCSRYAAFKPPNIAAYCDVNRAFISWSSTVSDEYHVLLFRTCTTASTPFESTSDFSGQRPLTDLPSGVCTFGVAALPRSCSLSGDRCCVESCCFDYTDLSWNVGICTVIANVHWEYDRYVVNESNGMVDVCVVAEGFGFEASISVRDITAQRGKDFIAAETTTLHLSSPNNTRYCVTVPIMNDPLVEDKEEQFSLTLSSQDPSVTVTGQSVAVVTITDNDSVNVTLERNSYSIGEGDGALDVCVVVDGALERNVTVLLSTKASSALGLFDFVPENLRVLTLSTSYGRWCYSVTIEDNTVVEEEAEEFSIVLTSADPAVVVSGNTTAVVTIHDNDYVYIGFEAESYSSREGDGSLSVCVIVTESLERNVTVIISTAHGDTKSVSRNLILSATARRGCLAMAILEDTVVEENTEYRFFLTSDDSAVIVTRNTSYGIVYDNDYVEVGFENESYSVGEGDGSLSVCVVMNGSLGRRATVFISIAQDNKLTFDGSQNKSCTELTIVDDHVIETNGVINVSIWSNDPAVLIYRRFTVVHIRDNDSSSLNMIQLVVIPLAALIVLLIVGISVISAYLYYRYKRNHSSPPSYEQDMQLYSKIDIVSPDAPPYWEMLLDTVSTISQESQDMLQSLSHEVTVTSLSHSPSCASRLDKGPTEDQLDWKKSIDAKDLLAETFCDGNAKLKSVEALQALASSGPEVGVVEGESEVEAAATMQPEVPLSRHVVARTASNHSGCSEGSEYIYLGKESSTDLDTHGIIYSRPTGTNDSGIHSRPTVTDDSGIQMNSPDLYRHCTSRAMTTEVTGKLATVGQAAKVVETAGDTCDFDCNPNIVSVVDPPSLMGPVHLRGSCSDYSSEGEASVNSDLFASTPDTCKRQVQAPCD